MATKCVEPGGDAPFSVDIAGGSGGFWSSTGGTAPTAVTDIVHGAHIKSIGYAVNAQSTASTPNFILANTGSRVSVYVYLKALPSGVNGASIFRVSLSAQEIRIKSTGVLILVDNTNGQIGSDGPTLSTGKWYRICLAYTATSTSINRFEVFVNGLSAISVTNATLGNTPGSSLVQFGNIGGDTTLDLRTSDHYVDDSSSLTDTGNIWVTAKRPNANGTVNGFTTQIGAGGSGYGTGHSPQVNERAFSTTNGWSMIGAGSAVNEEYLIESAGTGDINITGCSIVDYVGWVCAKSLASETANMILSGNLFNISLTSLTTTFTKAAASTSYPTTGAMIGLQTATDLTTVSLYECGILIAYNPFPAGPFPTSNPSTAVSFN